jgi:hypothetical protein
MVGKTRHGMICRYRTGTVRYTTEPLLVLCCSLFRLPVEGDAEPDVGPVRHDDIMVAL